MLVTLLFLVTCSTLVHLEKIVVVLMLMITPLLAAFYGATSLSLLTLVLLTLGITTLSMTTLSIIMLSMTTLSTTTLGIQ